VGYYNALDLAVGAFVSQQDKPIETICPVCGDSNQCAMASGKPVSECWCISVTIAPQALAAIPAPAVGKYCLCPKCATATGDETGGR